MEQKQPSGFGRGWVALTIAFALHVLDEATSGFLIVYNATIIELRARWGWFHMPVFRWYEWLVGLIVAVAFCFALTPVASRGAAWLRPLAWIYAVIMFSNGISHMFFTVMGHTVATVRFSPVAPGFYSSPLLLIGSVWLMLALRKTSGPGFRRPAPATNA